MLLKVILQVIDLRVWIFQTGEPLHCDVGFARPMRAINLANTLVARGHEVTIWSSAFYHQEKHHRSRRFECLRISKNLTINLIPSIGYKKNIGLMRLLDHFILAINLVRALKKIKSNLPDVAFVGYPPIESAYVMVRWLKKRKIPTIVDAKDQWPTIFTEAFPKSLRPIAHVLFWPYFYLARAVMTESTALCAMSDAFVDWMCEFSVRQRGKNDLVAPLTAPHVVFDDDALQAAIGWLRERGINSNTKNRVIFVGSLSSAFDFKIVKELANLCINRLLCIQFVIAGDGDRAHDVREMFVGMENVVFTGWIDAPKIKALSLHSCATIAPYVQNDAFSRSIPNKIIDSLIYGLPILTTLTGTVEHMLTEAEVGISSDSAEEMFYYLQRLVENPFALPETSSRAVKLHSRRFSFDVVYGSLVDSIENLARLYER